MPETIGYVGVGLMGYGMCRSLLRHGFAVKVVAHRRRDRIEDLVSRGAEEMPDITSLAGSVDTLMLCLPSPVQVRDLMLGDDSLLDRAPKGLTILDCTTSESDLTVQISEAAAARGITYIDLPVMKGPRQALEGDLNVIVGAEQDEVAKFQPLFEAISNQQFFTGARGDDHRVKILNNSLATCMLATVCETFATAAKAGVNLDLLYEVTSSGFANSPMLQETAPKIIADDYEMMATVTTFGKDVGLFVDLQSSLLEKAFMGPAAKASFDFAGNTGYREDDGSQVYRALLGPKDAT